MVNMDLASEGVSEQCADKAETNVPEKRRVTLPKIGKKVGENPSHIQSCN
jgi:hypothetical protein